MKSMLQTWTRAKEAVLPGSKGPSGGDRRSRRCPAQARFWPALFVALVLAFGATGAAYAGAPSVSMPVVSMSSDPAPAALKRAEISALGIPPSLPTQRDWQSNELLQGDLRVARGEVVAGDTVVYEGDVWVETEGRIAGDLVVFSGDVTLDEGAVIDGNADLFNGSALVAGTINGNLALWNGDVTLHGSARVTGDVSVLNGTVDRAPEAFVGGTVVQGPSFGFTPPSAPRIFGFGPDRAFPVQTVASGSLTLIQWVGVFLVRLLGAVLLTALVAVLVGLAVHVRPDAVATVRARIVEQPAASFVVGLAANLILVFMGGLLAITVCLLPIALVPMLALLAINLLGWAALAQWLGVRLAAYGQRPMESWLAAGLGAVVITSVFALLWAFGGFFRFVGGSVLLFIASFGAGAVLLPWIMRALQPARSAASTDSQPSPASSAATMDAPASGWQADVPTATTSAAGADDVTGDVDAAMAERPATPVGASDEAQSMTEPPDDLDEGDLLASTGAEEAGLSAEAQPVAPDDFTQLKGVGPVLDGRLKDAGITTFGQLAARSAAEVAEIVGWSEERVARSGILEQAREAASSEG